MAFSITSSYVGKAATDYITPALLGGKTLSGGYVNVLPNVKFKEFLRKATVSTNIIQTGSTALWNPVGTVTLSDNYILPTNLFVQSEFDKTQLEKDWVSEQLKAGANNETIPDNLEQFMIELYQKEVSTEIEKMIWVGNATGSTSSYLDYIDGFTTLMKRDSNVTKVSGIAIGSFSTSNVVTELTKVYTGISDSILYSDDLKIFVPPAVYKIYGLLLASSSLATYSAEKINGHYSFQDIELVPTIGLIGTNNIIAAETHNLVFGTDLEDDLNEVSAIDLKPTLGIDMERFAMRFKAGVQYGKQFLFIRI